MKADGSKPHQFLRIKDVAKLLALSKSHIYALQAKGLFPKSVQIAPKVSVWTEAAIRKWQDQQMTGDGGGR